MIPSQMQSIAMRVTAQARHCMAPAIMASIRAHARTHAMAKSMSTIPTAASGATATASTATATTSACAMREDRVS